MKSQEFIQFDGIGLAGLVRKKEVHPKELIEAAITRIEEVNPKLNAVVNKMYEKAINEASQNKCSGAFNGVPILLKDIQQEVAGELITSGSNAYKNYCATEDSEFVRRLREAGMIFLGHTNVPEFALMGITEPKASGPTRNPWNTDYTPGGSSGGSAAAVASGMVPIAGASDGGGSIRIPAAYTGLFGIKPTRGRTPVGPSYGRIWQGASVSHVLTRSVRDSAAILDEISSVEKTSAFTPLPFYGSYLEELSKPVSKLRVAFTVKSPLGRDVDPNCKEAVYQTAKLLESMGHMVEEKDAPVDGRKIGKSYITMYFGEVGATIASLQGNLGRKVTMKDVEPSTWMLGLLGQSVSASEFVLSMREWDEAAIAMERFHETYDIYLTPTTASPPAKIGELDLKPSEEKLIKAVSKFGMGKILKKTGIVDQLVEKSLSRTPYTQLANLTGQPAMSVPLWKTSSGLPLGVQMIAARGREDILYRLAGVLEQTGQWIDVKTNEVFAQ
ncbi:amidase family protein [Ferdinandcohnia quinoae]|uniref:Amidase family protein n=1 Tax=Fredinandcohnia quinoae TaxID=2918902 RepID=A0AAW5E4J4_9BACI|nr:amidase family protein [Fredinandcohnia sp. SECRCQ15]